MRLLIDHSLVNEALWQARVTSLYPTLERLGQESFFHLPQQSEVLTSVKELVQSKVNAKLKLLFLVGIGGSSEGAQAIYEVWPPESDPHQPERPQIIFLEGLEPLLPAKLQKLLARLNRLDELLITVISLSGKTQETLTNYELVLAAARARFGESLAINDRLVFISRSSSPLALEAKKLGASFLPVAENIGGRYSLFSPAGLFPLAAAGLAVEDLCAGATEISEWLLAPDFSNPALVLAALDYEHFEAGRSILVDWFDRPSLESLGKWGRQLVAESLGKNGDGPTPLVAVAENDRHSLLQLDLGGPDNKFFHFISSDRDLGDEKIVRLKHRINEAVLQAYRRAHRPYLEIILPDSSLRSLGAYCQLRFAATVLMANLLDVDPFNQPEVEAYKLSM